MDNAAAVAVIKEGVRPKGQPLRQEQRMEKVFLRRYQLFQVSDHKLSVLVLKLRVCVPSYIPRGFLEFSLVFVMYI